MESLALAIALIMGVMLAGGFSGLVLALLSRRRSRRLAQAAIVTSVLQLLAVIVVFHPARLPVLFVLGSPALAALVVAIRRLREDRA